MLSNKLLCSIFRYNCLRAVRFYFALGHMISYNAHVYALHICMCEKSQ